MQTSQPPQAPMQPAPAQPGQPQQAVMAPAPPAPLVQHTHYAPQPTQQQHVQPTYQPQHPAPAAVPRPAPVAQPAPAAPPQPGQQPGQHFPQHGLNGGWQSDQDYQERRKMVAKM